MTQNKSYTILFVDDEPWLVTQPLQLSLESRGYNCILTENASDGLRILQSQVIDVVVTDIMMPGGDLFSNVDTAETGFAFIQKVRSLWPRLSIICLSVIADASRIQELKSQNVLYMRKGETPLNKALKLVESKATGTYSRE